MNREQIIKAINEYEGLADLVVELLEDNTHVELVNIVEDIRTLIEHIQEQ